MPFTREVGVNGAIRAQRASDKQIFSVARSPDCPSTPTQASIGVTRPELGINRIAKSSASKRVEYAMHRELLLRLGTDSLSLGSAEVSYT